MQKDGTMKVLNGQLKGVALVTEPAVRSARVSEVAASEDSETGTVTETTNPNEGDKMDNTTEPVAPAVEPVAAPEVAAATQTFHTREVVIRELSRQAEIEARTASDAETPLTPDRVGRLRAADHRLCSAYPAICPDPDAAASGANAVSVADAAR